MSISLLLGRVIALFLIIMGLSLLVNRDEYRNFAKEIKKNGLALYFGGASETVFALLILVSHNIWTADWRVLVTITGWLMLFEGMLVLLLPNKSINLAQIWRKALFVYIAGFLMIVVGMYLAYMTFISVA